MKALLRGTTWQAELLGGVTTFVTMAYILFVNPAILAGTGLPAPQLLTVTALVAGVMSIAMGLVANYPFAVAPGMGINAAVATSLVGVAHLTPAEAMGVIAVEGLAITLLVLTGAREAILDAIPTSLEKAIGAGIGLFLALIGLVNGGLVVHRPPLLGLGDLHAVPTLLFIAGLLLALGLTARKIRGALLIAIAAVTLAAILLGETAAPPALVAFPDFALVGNVSFHFIAKLGLLGAALAVFSLMLSDFFDTIGTAVGLGEEGQFMDANGRLPRMRRVLLVDSLAAIAGGAASASSATTYIESASGIAPPAATASALVVVGFLMASMLRDLDWKDLPEAAPAFLCAVTMPFTWSISNGIGAGVIAHVVLMTIAGRRVALLVWGVAAAFGVFFAVG